MPNRAIHYRFGLIGNNFELKENIFLKININGKIVKIGYDSLQKSIELTTKTQNASLDKIREFKSKRVKIIKSGKGNRVDQVNLLLILSNMRIRTILLEGRGNLNWSFVKHGLIDETKLTIAPWIVGGKEAIGLIEGAGFDKIVEASEYKLIKLNNRDNYIVLRYKKDENEQNAYH